MRGAVAFVVSLSLAGTAAASRATSAQPLPIYRQVLGAQAIHVVVAGETLGGIASRFGIKTHLAATINELADPNRLRVGQRLLLSNRHIVPAKLRNGLVINVGDLLLYWLRDDVAVADFPVGLGRATWQTPPGRYRIVGRRRDPTWHVPRSIQEEMRQEGEPVKKKVAPGPENPLGKYWLQLSAPGYGIHGTNAPWTVGKYTTHGCIRLFPNAIERLYEEVPNGTRVDIVNEPIKVARAGDDTVLLEAHPGIAVPAAQVGAQFLRRLQRSSIAGLVDFAAAQRVVRDAWGIAVDVSRKKVPAPLPRH